MSIIDPVNSGVPVAKAKTEKTASPTSGEGTRRVAPQDIVDVAPLLASEDDARAAASQARADLERSGVSLGLDPAFS